MATRNNKQNKIHNSYGEELSNLPSMEPSTLSNGKPRRKKSKNTISNPQTIGDIKYQTVDPSSNDDENNNIDNDIDSNPEESKQSQLQAANLSDLEVDYNENPETYQEVENELESEGEPIDMFAHVRTFPNNQKLSDIYEACVNFGINQVPLLMEYTVTTKEGYHNIDSVEIKKPKYRVQTVLNTLSVMRNRNISTRFFFPNADVPPQFIPVENDDNAVFMQKLLLAKYLYFMRDDRKILDARLRVLATKPVSQLLECIQRTYDILEDAYGDGSQNRKGFVYKVPKPENLLPPHLFPVGSGTPMRGLSDDESEQIQNPIGTSPQAAPNIAPPAIGANVLMSGQKQIDIPRNLFPNNDIRNEIHTSQPAVSVHLETRNLDELYFDGKIDSKRILKLVGYIKTQLSNNRTIDLNSHFGEKARLELSNAFGTRGLINKFDVVSQRWWNSIKIDEFLKHLETVYKKDEHSSNKILTKAMIQKAMETASLKFDVNGYAVSRIETTVYQPLKNACIEFGEPENPNDVLELIALFYRLINKKGPQSSSLILYVKNHLAEMEAHISKLVPREFLKFQNLTLAIGCAIEDIRFPLENHYIKKWNMFEVEKILAKGAKDVLFDSNESDEDNKSKKQRNNNSKFEQASKKQRSDKKESSDAGKASSSLQTDACNGCGRKHGSTGCKYQQHPNYNHSGGPWRDSTSFNALKKKFPKFKPDSLFLKSTVDIQGNTIDGVALGIISADQAALQTGKGTFNKRGNKLSYDSTSLDFLNALKAPDTYDYKSSSNNNLIFISSSVKTGSDTFPVDALIDSGASTNYCSEDLADWIQSKQKSSDTALHNCKLPEAFSNLISISSLASTKFSITSNGILSCDFIFFNELTKQNVILPCLTFKIINMDIDLIIGLPTIRKYRLARKLPSVFDGITSVEPRPYLGVETHSRREAEDLPEPTSCLSSLCNNCTVTCHECTDQYLGLMTKSSSKNFIVNSRRTSSSSDGYNDSGVLRSFSQRLSTVRGVDACCNIGRTVTEQAIPRLKPTFIHRRDILGESLQDDEIVDKAHPIDNITISELPPDDLLDLITFEGSPALQIKLKQLCAEFRDIFSTTVREQPAKVPEMSFEIIEQQWNHKRSRLPPRAHSSDKQAEILKQINSLLELDVIEPSVASNWSQVHMVPKPASPGEWRLTIDFVKLNDATVNTEGWPITLIDALFQRLGRRKHSYYGVLDMTSGYFQGPLAKECRPLTAFQTLYGLYQWKRCPMGLKGAGQYFQRVMSSTVLNGLVNRICELYIDDVLISGETEDEYLTNVRSVFQRLKDFNVVIHPKKAKLGLSTLEYVGHTVDKEGLHFSEEKRLEILNFPKPTNMKHVQMFLGLANYYRDHVPHITELLAPLREMILDYDKRKKVVWNEKRELAFEKAKQAIHDCQKLYFIDPDITPILQTDASDYGIGGMLYQMKNDIMYPIRYISKSLSGSQLNWSTIEKECYAIFFCINKLKPLLGNSHFLLKTDHKNLTYMKDHERNCKVTRWKHALMEEDFSIEHVPGTEYHQQVPDALSRLVEDPRADIHEFLTSLLENQTPLTMKDKFYLLKRLKEKDELNLIVSNKAKHIENNTFKAISEFHNSSVGHFAHERVYQRMKAANALNFNQPKKWIKQFVLQCPHCQLLNRLKLKMKIRPFTTSSSKPFEAVSLDHIGPLHLNGKSVFVLVIIDCFSRWVELYQTDSTSAEDTAKCLFDYYGRYGAAETMSSDRGTAFRNEIVQQLVTLGGSDYEFTTAYSHQENAIVERHNAEVMRHLRAIMFDKRVSDSVANFLPIVQRIMNTLEKVDTGITPAEVIFGNNLRLHTRIFSNDKPVSNDTNPITLTQYMKEMLKQQEDILRVAKEHQIKQDAFHMQNHDLDYAEFPINSYVLYVPPIGKRRPKVNMTHDGPYQVVNRLGDIYTIQHLVIGKPFDTHISSLRPFFYDPLNVDPKDIAVANEGEFYIDKILDHRGDTNRRTSMEFLVRWLGYTEENDSWEPYSELRDTDQLLTYLRANRLVKLINSKHK